MHLSGTEITVIVGVAGAIGTAMLGWIKILHSRTVTLETEKIAILNQQMEDYKKVIEKNNRLSKENSKLNAQIVEILEEVVDHLSNEEEG